MQLVIMQFYRDGDNLLVMSLPCRHAYFGPFSQKGSSLSRAKSPLKITAVYMEVEPIFSSS